MLEKMRKESVELMAGICMSGEFKGGDLCVRSRCEIMFQSGCHVPSFGKQAWNSLIRNDGGRCSMEEGRYMTHLSL